jgi:hypothetical protein
MTDSVKTESLAKAKQMFDSFDIDNDDHSVILLMYDKHEGKFNMVSLNTSPGVALGMLDNATEAILEYLKEDDETKVLN